MDWPDVRLLAVGAHADDMDICAGGTIAKCARNGGQALMVDMAPPEGDEVRRAEALEAAAELGAERRWLGCELEPPWLVPDELAWKRELVTVVRQFMPNVVLTTNFNDHHPDHRRVASCVIEVCTNLAARSDILSDFQPWSVPYESIYLGEEGTTGPLFPEVEPNTFIDVTEAMGPKLRAMLAFRSQRLIADDVGESDSADELLARVLAANQPLDPPRPYGGCMPIYTALNKILAFKTGGDLSQTRYVEGFLRLKAGRSGVQECFS